MKRNYIRRTLHTLTALSILAFLWILPSSCCDDRGDDGRPGRAYLALHWEVDMPDYLNAGTPDIPSTFEWGRYYRAYPAWYTLYYEGSFFNGQNNVNYAWDMEYEIFEMAGKKGTYYGDGEDGPDAFFDLILSPFGPFIEEYIANKSTPGSTAEILEENSDYTVMMLESNGYGIKMIIRKAEAGRVQAEK
jgi:hypothetical protein